MMSGLMIAMAGGAVVAMVGLMIRADRASVTGHWMDQVRRHLERGEKAHALRLYQERTGCSHDDARRDLDAMSY